jgi:hypothetical protein
MLSKEVKNLEDHFAEMENLCGEIIATIIVNRKAGKLNSENNELFDWYIQSRQNDYKRIKELVAPFPSEAAIAPANGAQAPKLKTCPNCLYGPLQCERVNGTYPDHTCFVNKP